ncbi:MAG: hypothetical protein FWG30_07815 [Eubacteriaceae bacterium]|nr:hypothetical protein [Eubacteriaceae bacterium]
MAHLTPKENYLRIGRHEQAEYIPSLIPFRDRILPTYPIGLFAMQFGQDTLESGWEQPYGEWQDFWGATFINYDGFPAALPKPGHFPLKDIRHWDKFIQRPEVSNINLAEMANEELSHVNRTQLALTSDVGFQPFQQLVALMGFTEALCALEEEPEAVKEMLNYMADWYVPLIRANLHYWQPDIVTIADDTAAKYQPLFSLKTFRDIFLPIYSKLLSPAHEIGALIDYHNCGKCELFLPDMLKLGISYWNPCELDNNLFGIKMEHGRDLTLSGCWYYDVQPKDPQEKVRFLVDEYLDTFARDGGLIAMAFAGPLDMSIEDAPVWKKVNYWICDELYNYGTKILA